MPIDVHPYHIPLDKSAIIWRYMDMNKYISLLNSSALFFCRADKFSDPFEGSIPRKEAEYRPKEAMNLSEIQGKPFDEEEVSKKLEALGNLHKRFKRGTIINCWHINNNESNAMWGLYLKDNEGVAIQSTAGRIEEAMGKAEEKIQLSKVRYLDYENDIWYHDRDFPHLSYNLIVPLMHKRNEFAYEQEYRLFHQIDEAINNDEFWEMQENHKGRFIRIDLKTLVDKVYLPPTVDNSTINKIIELTRNSGYDFEFEVSKLKNEPYY